MFLHYYDVKELNPLSDAIERDEEEWTIFVFLAARCF